MPKVLTLAIARTSDGNGLPFPSYSSRYHVGLNLQAAVATGLRLEPGDRGYVPVGFSIGIPDGYCGFVVSLPTLAKEKGLVVLDAPQIVHPADRGPLFVLVQNMSSHLVVLHRGDFIAQLVIESVVLANWRDVSLGTAMGKVTQTADVVIDSAASASVENGADKMTSLRRVHKDARHRFSGDNKNE